MENQMKLNSENFKTKFNEISDECWNLHLEYLEDETGQVERYSDDDACRDTYIYVREFFKELGYTEEEIEEVESTTDY